MGSRWSAAAPQRSAPEADDPGLQTAAEPGAARTKARAGREPARRSATYLARQPLGYSASACCSWGTRARSEAGLVPQLLPGIPRRSADRASRAAPTTRPPAELRVRWLEARRRRGHSPLPAGAATSPPGRAPRSPAAVHPGTGRTAPPGEHPAGGDTQGSALALLHLGHSVIREPQARDAEPGQLQEPGREPQQREYSSTLPPLQGLSLGVQKNITK